MAYTRTTWISEATPVSAANLNNIEDGIEENKAAIGELNSKVTYQDFNQTIGNYSSGTPGTRALQYTIDVGKTDYIPIGVTVKSHPDSNSMMCRPFLKGDSNAQVYLNVYRASTGAYSSSGTCIIRVIYLKS